MIRKKTITLILLAMIIILVMALACKRVTITEYTIDSSSCNGCGECERICPADAVYYDVNNKAVIDQSKCTRCSECVAVCPQNAIY